MRRFSLDKILPSPDTFVLQKKFMEKIFANAVKVSIYPYMQSLTQDINSVINLPMTAGGEIGKNFYLHIHVLYVYMYRSIIMILVIIVVQILAVHTYISHGHLE